MLNSTLATLELKEVNVNDTKLEEEANKALAVLRAAHLDIAIELEKSYITTF